MFNWRHSFFLMTETCKISSKESRGTNLNVNDWYADKTIKTFGALFVVPQTQKIWSEFTGYGNVQINHFTQLELLNFVTKILRLRSSQILKVKLKRKTFALICSDHEKDVKNGIKRGFAFVGLNADGSLDALTHIEVANLASYVNVCQKQVNGYNVWRGMLADEIEIDD